MEEYNNIQEMTARDYIRVLFRQKAVIFTTIILVVFAVVLGVMLKTPVYQAQVKMLISGQKQAHAEYYTDVRISGLRTAQIALTQSEIVVSDPVIERSVAVLGLAKRPFDYEKKFCSKLKKPFVNFRALNFEKRLEPLSTEQRQAFLFRMAMKDLVDRIEVEPVRDTNIFLIKVIDYSPMGAALTANVLSRSYVIFDLEQQLAELQLKYGKKHTTVVQLREAIKKMNKSLNGAPLPVIDAIGPATIKIIEQAKVPLKPEGLKPVVIIILGLFMSIFLSLMFAFLFEYSNSTFKSPQEVETFLNLPFLGSIPKKKKFRRKYFQSLSEQLYLQMKDKGLQSVLCTSVLPNEGSTTVVSEFAKHLSKKAGHNVLVIDANLRNPGIYKEFKIPEGPGLADVLEGKVSFRKAVQNGEPNLAVLTGGKDIYNPSTLFDSSKLKGILEEAKAKYDVILIDCAELNRFKDGMVISSLSDTTFLIIEEGKTRRQVVKSAIAPLEKRKINIMGAILNKRRFVIPRFIYNWV